MRSIIVFRFVFLIFGFAIGVVTPTVADERKQTVVKEVRSILDPLVDEQLLPGFYLGVFDSEGLVLDVTRGKAAEAGELKPGPDILYAIMSMTKPIVSFAAIQLIEQGKLGLEDPVSKFIPEFGSLVVVEDGDLDKPQQELERAVTIRDLLTHTSGLTYSVDIVGREEVAQLYADLGIFPLDERTDDNLSEISDHVAALTQLPLVEQPGQRFIYSVSTDVLGRVLEIVKNQRLDSILTEMVFEPLGMDSTGFVVPKQKADRMAQMYRPRLATYPVPGAFKQYQPYEVGEGRINFGLKPNRLLRGGSGLISSANDYSKFLRMLLNGGESQGKRLLSKEKVEWMFTHQLPEQLGSEALVYNFGPSTVGSGFGYGLGISTKGSRNPFVQEDHDYYFWGGAANTGFWIDREQQLIGIFMAQHIPSQYNRTPELVEAVRKIKLAR